MWNSTISEVAEYALSRGMNFSVKNDIMRIC